MKAYDLLDVALKFSSGRCVRRIGVDWDDEVGELPAQDAGCDGLEAAEDWEEGDGTHTEIFERLSMGFSADRCVRRNNTVWWRWEESLYLRRSQKARPVAHSLTLR